MKRYLEKLVNCIPIFVGLCIITFFSTTIVCAGIVSASIDGINMYNVVTIIMGVISTFFGILVSLECILTEMMY